MSDEPYRPADQSQSSCHRGVQNRTDWLTRYEPWLIFLARKEIDSRFNGKFSASDAVQQTLLEAWNHWDNFKGEMEGQRCAWLKQILAHQLAHLARKYAGTKMRDVTREKVIHQSINQSDASFNHFLQDTISSPSVQVMREEQQLQLAAALERLPDDYRDVIVLRHFEDLNYTEIAERMNRSEGAVRMLWVRSLAQLRELGNLDQSK